MHGETLKNLSCVSLMLITHHKYRRVSPIQVAARPKTWVCGCECCVLQVDFFASGWSRDKSSSTVVCLSVIVKPW